MFRYVPVLVTSMLAVGSLNAAANPSVIRSTSIVPSTITAFAVSAAAQDDIAGKVKAALKADADLGAQADAVTVTAAGNVVTLEGTVPTVQIRAKIAEFVMKVDGVGKLVNKLKLAKK